VASGPAATALRLELVSKRDEGQYRTRIQVRVRNTGSHPAFLTRFDVPGTKRSFYGTDNWFWLAAGEERTLEFEILWRDLATRDQASLTLGAWNAPAVKTALK